VPVRAVPTHDILVTFERVFGLLRRLQPNDGLSLTAASTLHRLELDGARRLTELAGLEGVTQPAMTQLVSRLERSGLAARRADPQDGRAVLVEITDRGREVMRRRREARTRRFTDLLTTLDNDEQAAIVAALPALHRLTELVPPTS
jgi:DNA-binding MarR family transcriptional regulator